MFAREIEKALDAVTRLQNQATVVQRSIVKAGLHRSIHRSGWGALLKQIPHGKPNQTFLFKFHAANTPDRPALIGLAPSVEGLVQTSHYTYRELNDWIERIATSLHRRKIQKGTTILVMVKNRPEYLVIQAAIARLGASAVSVSWRSTAREIEYLAEHSGAQMFFFDADVAKLVAETAPNLQIPKNNFVVIGADTSFESLADFASSSEIDFPENGEDAAVVMYTSGTTGKPKGAVRKFRTNALLSALSFIGQTPMCVADKHLAVLPLYHATAFAFSSLTILLGGTVVVLQEFRPEYFLEAVDRYRIASTALVPTMLYRILELDTDVRDRYDTSSLTSIISGGAPLSAPLARDVISALGPRLYNFYGATETGIVTLADSNDLIKSPGTIGRPIPGNDVRLLDEQGKDVAPGNVGELYVRSSMLVDGYHADEEATRASSHEGFFSVGDLARMDVRGCYHIEGRKRDMIISGGVNVYPAEVEAVLEAHRAIAEASVVGVNDTEWGERVKAFIVLRHGETCSENELRAYCREQLAGPKVPREFVFLDALPRNPTGKVLKRELRNL